MADAIFRHGDPTFMDHQAGVDIAAGQVLLIGSGGLTCAIAHRPIPAGEWGALAVGQGVYDVVCNDVAAKGAKVYWDNAAKKVTTTAAGNSVFGYLQEASTANALVEAMHDAVV